MAALKFLFLTSELILCNISPTLSFLFFYFGGRAFADPRRVGGATCI